MQRVAPVLLAAWTVAFPAGAGAAQRCALPGARFIARSPQAQLFSVAVNGRGAVTRRYFGCRNGHVPLLLTADIAPKSPRDTTYANTTFRIGGTWAAWVETTSSHFGAGEASRAIHVRSLAGAKRRVDVFTQAGAERFGGVAALRVGSNGAVAFLLSGPGGTTEVDGVAPDAAAPVALAWGRGIDRRSLRLGAGAVTFVQGGRSRSVALAEPPALPTGRAAGPEGLDARFGDCGTLVPAPIKPAPDTAAMALARAPGGLLVAAGTSAGHVVVARFGTDGKLDPAFGSGGVAAATAPGPVVSAVVQADGKVVVATRSALLRFAADGKLDPAFGSGGVARPGASIAQLALAPDGALLAAGRRDGRSFVARFRGDGSLDPAFGTGGVVTGPGRASALLVAADGTVVVGGAVANAPLLVRLSATGARLSATTVSAPGAASIAALAPLAGGGYAAAGAISNIEGRGKLLLARFGADGAVQAVTSDPQIDAARRLALDAQGRWLVTTAFDFAPGIAGDGLVRYTAAGARDGAFGVRGGLGGTTGAGLTDGDLLLGDDGTAYVAQDNGGAFAVSRFALDEPALGATAAESSVCAMLVSGATPAALAASRRLPVGLRLRRPGRIHLHATVTVGKRTVVLGDATFFRGGDEAAVTTIRVSRAAAGLLRGATRARLVITGGAPGGPVTRYAVTAAAR